MKPEYALSVRQPWAWLLCAGLKDIENRTRCIPKSIRLPMRVYIHAGKAMERNAFYTVIALNRYLPISYALTEKQLTAFIKVGKSWSTAGIIGEVTITDCVTDHPSPWFEGLFGFVCRDPVLYPKPIRCPGRLGFWKPVLP